MLAGQRRGLFKRRGSDVDRRHAGALREQGQDELPADPASGTSDDDDFVLDLIERLRSDPRLLPFDFYEADDVLNRRTGIIADRPSRRSPRARER